MKNCVVCTARSFDAHGSHECECSEVVRPGKHDRHTRNTTKTDTLSRPTSHAELSFSDIPNASTGDAIGSVPPGLDCVGIEPDIMPLSSSSCANADGFLVDAWRPTRLSSCAYLIEV